MDIPGSRYGPRPGDPGPPLPSIYVNHDSHTSGPRSFAARSGRPAGFPSFSPSVASVPMSIPGASADGGVPPPLPPPRYPPVDGPPLGHGDYRRPEPYVDSVYGSAGASLARVGMYEERPDYRRRDVATPYKGDARDEGYSSLSSMMSSARSQDPQPARFRVHDQYQFRSGTDSYDAFDSQMLKKLDSRRPLDNNSPPRLPPLSTASHDPAMGPTERPMMQLKPLSLPTRFKQQPALDSPVHYVETPVTSATSPRSTPFSHHSQHSYDYRSPIEPMSVSEFQRSPLARNRRTNSGSVPDDVTVSTLESYGENEADFPMDETTRLRAIHLDEGHHSRMSSMDYQAAGQKRRASSPPRDEPHLLHSMASSSDLLRRREGMSRGSPTPRLTVAPQSGSISSVSSAGRSGSYASNLSLMTASSMTSAPSFGRRSPIGLSPGGLSPTDPSSSPYATPNSMTTSPRSAVSQRNVLHSRTVSDQKNLVSPRKLAEVSLVRNSGGVAKIQGLLMCECCPKKPKKFETEEDLRAHEAEKQYECSFCGNRFKNKNEAERHQNSLHVRRHSWSCSALSGYDRAFHESTNRPGEADTCGYCGEEFTRSGHGPAGHMRHATDQDWDERIRHLQDVHKFRECNSSKKFYRADHFRQHLKHSHAGTSGKWTNMLENACMMEEEPPQPGR